MSKITETKPKTEPNIIFSGKKERLDKETGKSEKVPRESPTFIINGREKINLPDGLEKGAWVEPQDAETAKKLFASDFKDVKKLSSAK